MDSDAWQEQTLSTAVKLAQQCLDLSGHFGGETATETYRRRKAWFLPDPPHALAAAPPGARAAPCYTALWGPPGPGSQAPPLDSDGQQQPFPEYYICATHTTWRRKLESGRPDSHRVPDDEHDCGATPHHCAVWHPCACGEVPCRRVHQPIDHSSGTAGLIGAIAYWNSGAAGGADDCRTRATAVGVPWPLPHGAAPAHGGDT